MIGINDLIGPAAVLLLIAIGLTVISHQKDTITKLELEREELTAKLKAQAEAMARADTQVAQLNRKLQAMRKQATAKEDKLNGQLKESAKIDDCLNRTVDRAIIDLLRQQGGDK